MFVNRIYLNCNVFKLYVLNTQYADSGLWGGDKETVHFKNSISVFKIIQRWSADRELKQKVRAREPVHNDRGLNKCRRVTQSLTAERCV